MVELDPLAHVPDPILHRAARVEDWIQERREARALRGGRQPAVIAYAGYGGEGWVRVLCRVLLVAPGEEQGALYANMRGWRTFTSISLTSAEVTVASGSTSVTVTADRGGVVDAMVPIALEPGWQSVTLTVPGSEPIEAPIFVVDPATRVGVVSDIDDTVMVTLLPRPMLAAWNAFVLDENARRPVPGMSVFYDRIRRANPTAPFIYLSTGAWNVAPALGRFLSRNLYPPGPMILTDWGPTHDRFFRSGQAHKRKQLRRLRRDFPDIRWLLVGDDGQHDEAIYADFAQEHPESVAAVAIRQLSPQEAVLAGGRKHERQDSPVPWYFSPNGGGLVRSLREDGIALD